MATLASLPSPDLPLRSRRLTTNTHPSSKLFPIIKNRILRTGKIYIFIFTNKNIVGAVDIINCERSLRLE